MGTTAADRSGEWSAGSGSARAVVNLGKVGPAREAGGVRLPAVLAALVAAALGAASFRPLLVEKPVLGLLDVMVVVAFSATAAVLSEERDQRGTAAALALTAVFYMTSWWWTWPSEWQVGPVPLISYVCGYLWFVFGALALLRYPDPELARWWDRAYVLVLGTWVVVPKMLLVLVSRPEWANVAYPPMSWWPTVVADEELFRAGSRVAGLGLVAVAVPVVVPLFFKVRRSSRVDRIDAVPVVVAAATVMVSGSLYLLARLHSLPGTRVDVLRAVIAVAALFTPLAFLGSALRRRLDRASLADLIVRLGDSPTPDAVQDELRRRLRDPTVTVWFWLPDHEVFVDVDDVPTAEPPLADRYRVDVRTRQGALLAVLALDPALRRHPAMVAPAAAACRFALENSRMQADLRAQLSELRASALRLAQAELTARRKIERDLHDGAQQTLLAVRMSLGTAKSATGPGTPAHAAIVQAQRDLAAAGDDLRRLARGISPPILTQSGLRTALDGVVEGLGVNVTASVLGERFDAAIETTAYFVACEALTNAVRHAGATRVALTVERVGAAVRIQVADDGVGGARVASGSGLAGIRDRATTIGGRMVVHSPEGGGTRIEVDLPCG